MLFRPDWKYFKGLVASFSLQRTQCALSYSLEPPPQRLTACRSLSSSGRRRSRLTSSPPWLARQFPSHSELWTGHQIPHSWRTGSRWLACVWPNAPTISLIFRAPRTAASVNQWDLCVISIYEGTTRLPCCHGFPSLGMGWKETENRTLFSWPLPATGRLEASLNRMEMTSWILIIYLCTLLYLLIAWIFHLILKILIWNCQWSKAGKQNRAGYDFFFPFFFLFYLLEEIGVSR